MHVLRNSVMLQISDILKDPEILNLLNNMYTFEEVCYTSFDAMMKTRTVNLLKLLFISFVKVAGNIGSFIATFVWLEY